MLVLYYLDKHIYDIMAFLLMSILWNKLNMNLPKFLTLPRNKWVKCQTIRTKPGHMKHLILYLKPKHLQIGRILKYHKPMQAHPYGTDNEEVMLFNRVATLHIYTSRCYVKM